MKGKLGRLLLSAACIAWACFLASCSTVSNPAAPPAPPIELPSPLVLKFVEFDEIRVDLGALTGSAAPAISKAFTPGESLQGLIKEAATYIEYHEDELLIPVTEGLGAIEIPVSADIQAFEGEVTFVNFSDFIVDTFFGTHDVKLDFRDYDFDNDGVTEGCSGHTAALPVCVQFWLDDVQFIAWVFDTYPIPEDDPETPQDDRTVGSGRFKIVVEDPKRLLWEIGASYGQGDFGGSTGKGYDIFMQNILTSQTGLRSFRQHLRVAREIPETSALTVLDLNAIQEAREGALAQISRWKSAGRYVEGFDLWASSYMRQVSGDEFTGETNSEESAQDICALISTEIAVDPAQCEDVNGHTIRVLSDPLFPEDGHPFIATPTDADVAMPASFPAAPPADFVLLPKP